MYFFIKLIIIEIPYIEFVIFIFIFYKLSFFLIIKSIHMHLIFYFDLFHSEFHSYAFMKYLAFRINYTMDHE
jgi:hypothetical protein